MRHLNLFTGGIKGAGILIHKGELLQPRLKADRGMSLSDIKAKVEMDYDPKLGEIGSSIKSSVKKAIKPLKYKF